jgi:hypothetical protein
MLLADALPFDAHAGRLPSRLLDREMGVALDALPCLRTTLL